ncbi:hypothetical protein OG552_28910 [Streptomyces sp. NBC_01476]|uniref:hypothetical protein n=1 Tax=Streptomyces sp. NBC_01476 TaxID=2903881 RepID=UPI002E333CD0|nr:hypothetical protein [Streptomyces sp. NBC_01476]
MTTERARATADFTYYFRSLVAALGDRPGWYPVFAEREPGAARAYDSGSEVPPWDVVRALLHDLAAAHGAGPDPAETSRALALHRAAIAAWDTAPGAERALRARLDAASRAHDLAVLREHEAARTLDQGAATASEATVARLGNALAWARDDRERAAARLTELHARLVALPGRTPLQEYGQDVRARRAAAPAAQVVTEEGTVYRERRDGQEARRPVRSPYWGTGADTGTGAGRAAGNEPAQRSDRPGFDAWEGSGGPQDTPRGAEPEAGSALPPNAPASRRARFAPAEPAATGRAAPRGARFAGAPAAPAPGPEATVVPLPEQAAKPRGARFAGAPSAPAPAAAVPAVPAAATGKAAPRGARFAGAPAAPGAQETPEVPAEDPRLAADARAGAARLGELRRAGESGAAYLVLCEAALGPPECLPYLARELERADLGADVATLLWEVAVLPPDRLAAAAAALAADGRTEDSRTLLRQAAGRPAKDIATVAAVLHDSARSAEAGELLETLTRVHSPEDAVDVARTAPGLTPALLAAAERVSKSRRRDIVAALRRAALPDH